jgi:RNA polymerase sigma-70 factor (ECF subfamily)
VDAFATQFRRLKSLLSRRGRTPHDTEDLIQEAYLRMQVYFKRGQAVREPEAFLVRTVLRLHSNARRYDRRHPNIGQPVDELVLLDTSPLPDEVLEGEQCLRRLREALDSVNPRTREIFFLHRLDQLTYAQIATQIGISVSAVEKHIANAVAILMDWQDPP